MARLVTRVTSKNFCIVNPSFELSAVTDGEGVPMIQVTEGQACINGMDIIATQQIRIYHPDEEGDYYLALHLWRDSSDNVLGDLVIGVTTEFHGVYLDWFSEKDATDRDALWLGKVHWDGTEFSDIEEDLDKYGRIWAEDILCKMEDWKHPDESRMLLQDWMYKVPDWYVSKEGDVIFGPIEFLAGRDPEVEGTLDDHEDIGSGKYGVRIEAVDGNTTNVIIKAPDTAESATNNIFKITETNTGLTLDLGPNKIESKGTAYNLDITSPNIINMTANKGANLVSPKTIKIDSTGEKTIIHGQTGVELSSGANNANAKLTITDNNIEMSDATCGIGSVKTTFASNKITQKFGNNVTATTDGSTFTLGNTGDIININTSGGNNSKINMRTALLDVTGEITALKVWNAVYNGFGEIFRKSAFENIEYGDIVCVREDGLVHKVNSENDLNTIIGICSNTIGIGLGGKDIPEEEQVEVEMLGQIWVKTNKQLEAGRIVKALPDGTVDYTDNTLNKFGITLTNTIDGKVRIVYNG